MKAKFVFGALLATAGSATPVAAAIVTYTFSGTVNATRCPNDGSGLGCAPITGSFTLGASFDTASLTAYNGGTLQQAPVLAKTALFNNIPQSTIATFDNVGLDDTGYLFIGAKIGSGGGVRSPSFVGWNGATPLTASTFSFVDFRLYSPEYSYRIIDPTGVTFAATVATAGVPEPKTWAMMLLGFGGVGYAMRRNSKVSTRIEFA